ncbi:uroporphyrinogen-III C-methyltransferase [Guyparkeria hydrothermalis]|uniref:uroporphyrinogen-III C-methyltransferase n=1 Tax=Guyparkeria hydrothermalis TaxID=923 RepID=UPI002020DC91|nr:uroporphyrinogen-III C-methyltransferase [Guyparkeria hydrothermalis]MCL7745013.1 uroporphyrinogen-III C-methyltransferase [Guyparkeria hydrothermalis]
MDKKQRDKQTEEQSAEKSTESTASSSTGTAAKETDAAKASTSTASSGSGKPSSSRRPSRRRSKGSKASSGSTATAAKKTPDEPKAADDKAASKPDDASKKPAAKGGADTSADGGKSTAAPAGKTPRGTSPRSGVAMPWLVAAIALLFALAAVGGWQLWRLDQAQQSLSESSRTDQQQLADRLETLSGDISDTQSSIDTLEQRDEAIREEVESALSGQLDQLAERQDNLGQRVARIDDRLARGEIAWKTAEVGFLLTRAQERLVIARDPDGALLALKLADERVAALSRPHWLPLRSAISDAIATIEEAGEGDRVGQALALRRLGDRVDEWPLAGRADESPEPQETSEAASGPAETDLPPADAAWYEKAWAATTHWLSRQVSVTRSDTPVRLHERVATDREMRLWLTAVRESLLSRDRDALTRTLDESRDWLETHYAADAAGPAAALDALERIRTRFTSREFPSLDAVLRAWERASASEKARADETGKEAQS